MNRNQYEKKKKSVCYLCPMLIEAWYGTRYNVWTDPAFLTPDTDFFPAHLLQQKAMKDTVCLSLWGSKNQLL